MSGLEIRGLGRDVRGRCLLDDFELTVVAGQRIGVLGPNGAGKTTCFAAISGRVPASRGQVRLDGRDLRGLPAFRRARLGLVELPQSPTLFRGLSTVENIEVVLELRTRRSRTERRDAAMAALERFGLEARASLPAERLSGGERRRLELARTLALPPKVLLLDEPFAGVDPRGREQLAEHIRAVAASGVGVVVADHDARTVLDLCEEVLLLVDGCTVARGPPDALVADPIARGRYLGRTFSR